MSGLSRSGGGPPSRRAREKRAYRLVQLGGAAGVVGVVTAVLALVTSLSWGIPIVAIIVAVVCALMFRGVVSR